MISPDIRLRVSTSCNGCGFALSAHSLPVAEKEEVTRGSAEQWARPIGDEGQDADGEDVVGVDAVVGRGEVDRGDGVGVAEGEEREMLEEQDAC